MKVLPKNWADAEQLQVASESAGNVELLANSAFRPDPTNVDADHCVRLQIVPFLIFPVPIAKK